MAIWIKICGNTTLEDAQAAVSAGANAVGFVFAASPRRVTASAVREITRRLPRMVETIGVFVDATLEEIADTVRVAGLTGVQLHATDQTGLDETGLAQALRTRFADAPGRLGILQTLHYAPHENDFALQLRAMHANPAVDAVLVDTYSATQSGGTGLSFDWQHARDSFFREAPHLRLIAAGGLRPENVRQAIYTLQPWGVDVSSGVESSPGRKDSRRVAEFVRAARAAALEMAQGPIPAQA